MASSSAQELPHRTEEDVVAQPVFLDVRPSKERILTRAFELAQEDPALAERLLRVNEVARGIRTVEVWVTDACNLRCKGCWFFEHDMDKQSIEIRDLDSIRAFAEDLRDSKKITSTLLIGGEPALVLDRVRVFAETIRNVTVVTNGTRPIPYDGLEDLAIAVSLWGGGPVDDELRGHRPNGRRISGLFGTALRTYTGDPRATWVYTLSEAGMPYLERTVEAIAANGNQINFGYYSDNGTDPTARLRNEERAIEEMTRMRETYPDTVIGDPYYFRTLVTGRTHWGTFGAETCPSISNDHPAHARRLTEGHPIVGRFNAYRTDHSVQYCATTGDCDNCRDSQAVWSWLLVNMHRFLGDLERLDTWVTLAENFYRQYYWSSYHPARQAPAESAVGA
ncbi:radical SAM protein [Nocardia testacea]|uniref:radical SAM protein n=1 Tax=Nocardia testacea TaxID=248551 RepID=UPI0033D97785